MANAEWKGCRMELQLALGRVKRLSQAASAITMSTNDLMRTAAASSQRLSDLIELTCAPALQSTPAGVTTNSVWQLGEEVHTVATGANEYASKSLWLIEQLAEQLHLARTAICNVSKLRDGANHVHVNQIDRLFLQILKNQVICEDVLETTAALVRTTSIFRAGLAQIKAGRSP